MVGSGEVDDDLEPETAEECAKYGKVVKCLIFEVRQIIFVCIKTYTGGRKSEPESYF